MSKTPLNYLITLAIGSVIWILTALVIGNYLSLTIALATLMVEDFLLYYRIFVTAAGIISLLSVYYWFYYGNKDSTAGDLEGAKRLWYSLFIIELVIAVVILLVNVILLLDEGVGITDYLFIYIALSLHTYIFFWLCTYLMSPRTVKYLVPLKR